MAAPSPGQRNFYKKYGQRRKNFAFGLRLEAILAERLVACCMLTTLLLANLIEIEHSIGQLDHLVIRRMVMEAQNQVLQIQQEHIGLLGETRWLREAREVRSPLCIICPFCNTKCNTCAPLPSQA